jgi:hypothetical protein
MNIQTQSWLINRRHALKALGSFISLPMLECMVPLRAADKTAADSPRRSAFIYLANGVHSLNYQITKEGRDYEFSRSLKPLEKHREVITPISGLHHPGALSHHHGCINVWLTGGKMGPADRNTISVDQKMAELTAPLTRYPSMEVALTGASLAWTADGVQLPSLRRCSEIFASLFEEPKGGKTVQRRALRRKGSVLDANLAEVRQLEEKMEQPTKAAWSNTSRPYARRRSARAVQMRGSTRPCPLSPRATASVPTVTLPPRWPAIISAPCTTSWCLPSRRTSPAWPPSASAGKGTRLPFPR